MIVNALAQSNETLPFPEIIVVEIGDCDRAEGNRQASDLGQTLGEVVRASKAARTTAPHMPRVVPSASSKISGSLCE